MFVVNLGFNSHRKNVVFLKILIFEVLCNINKPMNYMITTDYLFCRILN